MKPIVLDTDVVSFLFKADTRAQIYLPQLQDRQWFISFMTEAELEQWALLANWSEKRVVSEGPVKYRLPSGAAMGPSALFKPAFTRMTGVPPATIPGMSGVVSALWPDNSEAARTDKRTRRAVHLGISPVSHMPRLRRRASPIAV
jgi:hypothetical protein